MSPHVKKMLPREIAVFLTAFLVSATMLSLAAVGSWRQSAIQKELTPAEFERTVLIQAVQGNGPLSGQAASDFISSAPEVTDGLEAVFSRTAAQQLQTLQEVDSIAIIAKSKWKLTTPSGTGRDVTVFNVSDNFVQSFNLGESAVLKAGFYVPTEELRKSIGITGSAVRATLGIPDSMTQDLPLKMREAIDWSKAKITVIIPDKSLPNLQNSSLFSDALFTVGRERKIDIPGFFLFPKIAVLVKIRDDADFSQAMSKLNDFISVAVPANRQAKLVIVPFSSLFNEHVKVSYVDEIASHLNLGTYIISASLLILLAFRKHQQVMREIILRRTVGVPTYTARWASIKPLVVAILSAISAAVLAACITTLFVFSLIPIAIIKLASILMIIGLLSVTLLLAASVYFGNGDLATQLRKSSE